MSCRGDGEDINMTDFGIADSWPETMRTAVRSSIESPNEIISRFRESTVDAKLQSDETSDPSIDSTTDTFISFS